MASSAGKHDLGKVEAQGNVSDTVNIVSDIVADNSLAPAEEELEYVPDGGKEAWTVVLGSTLALFASSGLANSYGAFQDYYQSTLLPSTSSSPIALIGSLQFFLLYIFSPSTGRMFDAYGTSILVPLGCLTCVFAMMMVSLTQHDHAYQLFLSQGVLFGTGVALIYNPSVAALNHWFRRRRALVIGIVIAGSAIGGVVWPIVLHRLIPLIGFAWATRTIAFIMVACFTISCLTIKTRLPLQGHISWRTAVDLGGFKDVRYVLVAVAGFLLYYALFVPYVYIQIYADFRGVPSNISDYLLSILSATNILSRVLPGLLADRYGPLNIFIPAAALCSIFILGLWLPSRDPGTITAFATLYGLFSGALATLLPPYIADITPRQVYGARLGSVNIFLAVASLVGTPTAGALLKTVDGAHFDRLIVFSGLLMVGGTLFLVATALVDSKRVRTSVASLSSRRRSGIRRK